MFSCTSEKKKMKISNKFYHLLHVHVKRSDNPETISVLEMQT